MIVELKSGKTVLRVSPQGGVIVDAYWQNTPILRPYPDAHARNIDPLKCGSFPLIPFGNRLAGNSFPFNGETYYFAPNTKNDPYYIHGDGWLSDWQIEDQTKDQISMKFDYISDAYSYLAKQVYRAIDDGITIELKVKNTGKKTLPFGLGHHPFFPLTDQTMLRADAASYWTEKPDHLPNQQRSIPEELNFSKMSRLPKSWINNGFNKWSGFARIEQPKDNLAIDITAPDFDTYFLYRPGFSLLETKSNQFFCFEPMTHMANGHNLKNGGLTALLSGERLERHIEFKVSKLDSK